MSSTFDVIIEGDSMWPTFRHGDILSFRSVKEDETYICGIVVLASHPFQESVLIVKRIQSLFSSDQVFLEGDQPDPTASEDSHNFGPVDVRCIQGIWTGEMRRA